MPAKSKRQQRLMGMINAIQKGEMKAPSKKLKELAKSMKKKDTKDFASTKHKGLPEKVRKKKKKKRKKSYVMIDKLIKLANELDLMGLIDEADSVDKIAAIISSNVEELVSDSEDEEREDEQQKK